MTSERIKEIQEETAYPNSVSVQQALLKVWNECEQERVKNCSIPAVMLSLPSQDEIDEQIDKYAFRVPYDGSNNFYDEVALKHYKAGIEWLLGRIRGNGA